LVDCILVICCLDETLINIVLMLVGIGVVLICVELYRIGLIVSNCLDFYRIALISIELRWFELKSHDTVKFKLNIPR